MLTTDPRHPSQWWRENWQLPQSWSVCSRCGIQILRSHLANGVCRDVPECDRTLARREPIAAARTPDDGSLVVVYQPAGLEVRAFGAEDLDERGMPRWKP